MSWRLAESLKVLRTQVNAAYPKRRKSADGTIGDEAHASRNSDHNPWITDGGQGVVSAIDFTHDPQGGLNARKLAEALIASKDGRIKYVISNREICSGSDGPSPWKWRKYSGANPHDKHMHLSVKSSKAFYDSQAPWPIDFPKPKVVQPKEDKPLIKSKQAQAGGTIATIEAIDVATKANEVITQVGQANQTAKDTGLLDYLTALATTPRIVIGVIVILGIAAIIYWRWRDHGRGAVR